MTRILPFLVLLGCPAATPVASQSPPTTGSTAPSTDTDTDTDTTPPPSDLPPIDTPEDAGPRGVDTSTEMVDLGGPTPSMLRVFEPNAGNGSVVLLVPGFGLEATQLDSYARHLASHGWTSVGVDLGAGPFAPRSHSALATELGAAMDWAEDRYDVTRMLLVGHSLGGKLSLLRAASDDRISGVFAIDPVDSVPPFTTPDADNPSVTPELMPQVTIPLVLMGQNGDEGCAPSADNYLAYAAAVTGPAIQIAVEGANHMSWLDDPDCLFCSFCAGRSDDPDITAAMTRGALLAFGEWVERDRPGALDHLSTLEPHAGAGRVEIEVVNAP